MPDGRSGRTAGGVGRDVAHRLPRPARGGARQRDAVPSRRQAGRRAGPHVEIHDVDDDAVAYEGHADIDGERAIELVDCLGPMLPLADFDDPRAMAERFALLIDGGAPPGRFHGVQRPPIVRDGNMAHARRPRERAFLQRPLSPPQRVSRDAHARRADRARAFGGARDAGATRAPIRMTNVKVRSFTPPGTRLTLGADVRERGERETTFNLSAHADGKSVATARVVIVRRRSRSEEASGRTTRRRHRCRPRHPGRQRRRDDVERTACGQERRRADHAVRRVRLRHDDRGRGQGLREHARHRPQAAQAHEPLASLRARSGGAGAARRGHQPDRRTMRIAGVARSAPA